MDYIEEFKKSKQNIVPFIKRDPDSRHWCRAANLADIDACMVDGSFNRFNMVQKLYSPDALTHLQTIFFKKNKPRPILNHFYAVRYLSLWDSHLFLSVRPSSALGF